MHVGEKVRKIRNEKKLSLRQLATMTDMNHAYLSRIENGKVQPSVESLIKIAKALGCDVADFFEKKMEVDEELEKEGVQWVIFGKELEKEGITLEQVKEWIRAIKATKF
ncbi:transcriptional regulator with XRE-family HTH domain [Anoxybacillus kamchatkensis]|uniref:helix-turn-helix domain-containing protein n=1 Tax=Anoxybacillus ayderensis TaxID=265546 RepID=UPI0015EC7325|nr:helix-turn-helix transcriptional regulator [Anoxybacillus ayderensis]MBA2877992.1 transcriptional regulator with XRE-family HTH domain [Anoxybacillus ayderensis]